MSLSDAINDELGAPPQREPDQEDILATAMYLSQANPQLTGMTAEDWVRDAIYMREHIRAATLVYYLEADELPKETTT